MASSKRGMRDLKELRPLVDAAKGAGRRQGTYLPRMRENATSPDVTTVPFGTTKWYLWGKCLSNGGSREEEWRWLLREGAWSRTFGVQAPVAQWIEHQIPDLRVGGSSPSGRTTLSRENRLQGGRFFHARYAFGRTARATIPPRTPRPSWSPTRAASPSTNCP